MSGQCKFVDLEMLGPKIYVCGDLCTLVFGHCLGKGHIKLCLLLFFTLKDQDELNPSRIIDMKNFSPYVAFPIAEVV